MNDFKDTSTNSTNGVDDVMATGRELRNNNGCDYAPETKVDNECETILKAIRKGIEDKDHRVREAAMEACRGRYVPLVIIREWLEAKNCDIREAAMEACRGRYVPLDILLKGLKDKNWHVRVAALKACVGRDIPLDIIEERLEDKNWHVRVAALKVLEEFKSARTAWLSDILGRDL